MRAHRCSDRDSDQTRLNNKRIEGHRTVFTYLEISPCSASRLKKSRGERVGNEVVTRVNVGPRRTSEIERITYFF
jgi:hypothetical protein